MIGEVKTIAKIREGFSIARFGDGELGVMYGSGYVRQTPNAALSRELRHVIANPDPKCIVGIPTMDKSGDKYRHTEPTSGKEHGWHRHKGRFCKYLSPSIQYYSSLITRPDCGEWMRNKEYARLIQTIWLDKKVAVVGSQYRGHNKILAAVNLTQEAQFIEAPYKNAYAVIDELESQSLNSGCEMILLSVGVTATCLANRLSSKVQAVDIGSIGGFLLKMFSNKYD